MAKEGDSEEVEISVLNHLLGSLEDAGIKLEEASKKKDAGDFNKAKKLIIQIQTKILDVLK
jgi:hypothetical protein